MSHPTSAHARSSAAAQMACWESSFPFVARLWRELFKELLRSTGAQWADRLTTDECPPKHRDVVATHRGAHERNAPDLQSHSRLSYPASLPPQQPGTHAAGSVPPAGRTPFRKARIAGASSGTPNRMPDLINVRPSCAWPYCA
jgi:hypothetical protein